MQVETVVKDTRATASLRSWRNAVQAIASSQLVIWLGLTFLFAALPLFFIKHAALNDPDIWWHMRTGEWIVQNHRIPYVDMLSATSMGRPWVDYCWLFDVGSYGLVQHFDLVGIIWFQTAMRLAVTLALFSLLRSLTPGLWKAIGVTLVATLAMAWSTQPRPGAFSVLFLVLELHVLVTAKRKADPRWLWLLPPLFAVWANIHIEFVTGLFVLGVCCLEPLLDKLLGISPTVRTPLDLYQRQLWLASLASFLAVCVNPYGLKVFATAFRYAGDTKIYDLIMEFSAMHFRTINDWAVLALIMLACFALGRSRPFRPVWGVLLAWSAWMGFRSLREVWLIAILSAVIVSGFRCEEASASEENSPIPKPMRLAVAATVLVALLAGASAWNLSSRQLLNQVTETFPVAAVSYIHRNHLQGPLLNEMTWGGFLMYAMPEIPPAMDGRTHIHTQEELLRALPLWNGEAGWQNRPELQSANLVLSNHWWPLTVLLRNDPRFRVAYEDKTSVLFVAVRASNEGNVMAPQGH